MENHTTARAFPMGNILFAVASLGGAVFMRTSVDLSTSASASGFFWCAVVVGMSQALVAIGRIHAGSAAQEGKPQRAQGQKQTRTAERAGRRDGRRVQPSVQPSPPAPEAEPAELEMALCDTCGTKIGRAAGHMVSGPEAASIMRDHYEKMAKALGKGPDFVRNCLAMAAHAGDNLVCDQCLARILMARHS